jgi:RNA polymerase sigma-70 factor (ECF subfamily)
LDYTQLSPDALVLECLRTADEEAWREFLRRFHPLIARVVLRGARRWGETSPQVLDDLIQETYLKICDGRASLLKEFRPNHEGSIFGYIKVFTANLVQDHFKALHSQKRGGGTSTTALEIEDGRKIPSSSISNLEKLNRELLIKQIESCLNSLNMGINTERDRRIFWLYYRFGLPASEIASIPAIGLSTKGVESTLLRLTRELRIRLGTSGCGSAGSKTDTKGISSTESL